MPESSHVRMDHPIPAGDGVVHLIDGTYDCSVISMAFGGPTAHTGRSAQSAGVLNTVLQMIETGATHIGVATDHVIESFRNALWPGYKTGDGIDPALFAQFHPLEDALAAMGVTVWPMVELEADDALASAAALAAQNESVRKVCIWTPDKDLTQCVRGDRVVQVDRRSQKIRDAAGVRAKFGVDPALIPDFLALVGDAADGYPGIPRIGRVSAARLLNKHGFIEDLPLTILGENRELALLFKDLATLRTGARLFNDVEELRWRGPTVTFAAFAERLGESRLLQRCVAAQDIQTNDE